MEHSIIGFKTKKADLRRKSPVIFLVSFVVSVTVTSTILRTQVPEKQLSDIPVSSQPIIIQLTDIPKTRQSERLPAPAKPFVPAGIPLEVDDEFMPDDITIEDTKLDIDAVPSAPLSIAAAATNVTAVENEVYEYFAVEEPPKRLNAVSPVFPEMAERAGIKGTVVLKVLVNTKGTVDSIVVMEGPKVFHESSIAAAKETKFSPARHNDRSVACWIIMPFRFVFGDN